MLQAIASGCKLQSLQYSLRVRRRRVSIIHGLGDDYTISAMKIPLLGEDSHDGSSVLPAVQKLLQLAYSEDPDKQLEVTKKPPQTWKTNKIYNLPIVSFDYVDPPFTLIGIDKSITEILLVEGQHSLE